MPSAAFLTLGCKLNYAETSTYERALLREGWNVVSPDDKADVYVVNTCSVTATSDAKSRNLVRKVHRRNPGAQIYVVGCSAQLRSSELSAIEGVTRVFSSNEKSSLVSFITGKPTVESSIFPAYSTGERTRSFLKVQDGCNNYCAYCTVPYARGESRNVPVCECVKNAMAIAREGIKEIVLTGVNTGDFGRSTGETFLDLLKALHDVEGIERYRISSIEPNLLTDEIVDWIASEGTKFQPHFHIPLQVGSDLLLEKMGRHYTTAFFEKKISYIRHALEKDGRPKVFFGIDVMAGLPGETDRLFEETVEFLNRIKPAYIHVFPYSKRPGTPAAQMTHQVQQAQKDSRVKFLEGLCRRFHQEFIESNKGLETEVLFESGEPGAMMSGYTSNYIRISRPYDRTLIGKIVKIRL